MGINLGPSQHSVGVGVRVREDDILLYKHSNTGLGLTMYTPSRFGHGHSMDSEGLWGRGELYFILKGAIKK